MSDGGTIIVVIEANGPLPIPVQGFVENPPRMFFDFQGVVPRRRSVVVGPGFGVVRQTRMALYAANVTRVVLDLVKPENYRIDSNEREVGFIRIVLGPQVATRRAGAAARPRPTNTTATGFGRERTTPLATTDRSAAGACASCDCASDAVTKDAPSCSTAIDTGARGETPPPNAPAPPAP